MTDLRLGWKRPLLRAALLCITATVLTLAGGAAAAPSEDPDGTEPAPALSVAGEGAAKLSLQDTEQKPSSDLTGKLHVTLYNSGDAGVTPSFDLVWRAGDDRCASTGGDSWPKKLDAGDDADAELPAYSSRSYVLDVTMSRWCVGSTADLLISGTPDIEFVTAQVDMTRDIGIFDYGIPLLVALLAGVVFLLAAWNTWDRATRDLDTPVGDSWSFSGSWLTSVSALGAALAGVLTASGYVSEVLPGIPLGHFLGLSLTFTGLTVAAPMIFSIGSRVVPVTTTDDDGNPETSNVLRGTVRALLQAGAVTCAGVAGLLAMMFRLVFLSNADDLSKVLVGLLLLGLGAMAAVYVAVATRNAVAMSREPITSKEMLTLYKFSAAL